MLRRYLPFLKTGLLAFGGGISMLPYLEEIARQQLDIDDEGFLQIMAISQSFPGAMGINAAAILGFRMGGWPGLILALAGVTLPSMVFAVCLVLVLRVVLDYRVVGNLMIALKAAVVGLILGMVVNMGRRSWVGWRPAVIGLGAFAAFFLLKINPVWILLGAAILGFMFIERGEKA